MHAENHVKITVKGQAGKLAWADAANEGHCSLHLSHPVRTEYMYRVR